MRQRENEIINSLAGQPKEVLLDILEGRPRGIPGDNMLEKRTEANVLAIRGLRKDTDDQKSVLDALEVLRQIGIRKFNYMIAKQPIIARIKRKLAGEPKVERAYNLNPNPMGEFNLMRIDIKETLKVFERDVKD